MKPEACAVAFGGLLVAGFCFAQAPRVYVDTVYSPPPDSAAARVQAGGDLGAALDGAQAGDAIQAGSAWIRIRSLTPGSTASGRRLYTVVPPLVATASQDPGRTGLAAASPIPSAFEADSARGEQWGGWPMRSGDPANTGHAAALGPALQVQPSWIFQPDAGTLVWRPAVAPDGTIYVTTVSFPGAGVDGRLYALRPDGSVKWQTPLTNSSGASVWASATPVLDRDGNIYVAWAHDIDFGSITAISLDPGGGVRWRFEPQIALAVASHQQPVLGPGVLYAATDTSFFFGDSAPRASIFALDLATGAPVWQWISPNLDTFMGGPALGHDGYVYHASASNPLRGAPGYLYRIGPDGNLDWSASIGAGVIDAPPAIDAQNNLYVGDAAGMASKYSPAGVRLWTYDTGSRQIYDSPALNGARVTVGAAFSGLHVLDAATGSLQAVFAPGRYPFSQASDRAGNAFFYCFDTMGTVFGFGHGGRQWWTFDTGFGSSVNAIAIAADGRLLVGDMWALRAYVAPVLGDLNCDGKVDALDIAPYFLALTDPAKYARRHPQCSSSLADVNGDGTVDALDLVPFLRLIGG